MKVEGGKSTETPVSIIENASMPSQRLLTTSLGQLAEVLRTEAVKPPALFVIGEVADKHMQLG